MRTFCGFYIYLDEIIFLFLSVERCCAEGTLMRHDQWGGERQRVECL